MSTADVLKEARAIREIKFRAWAPFPMLKRHMNYQHDKPLHEYFTSLNMYAHGDMDTVVVMQYTGLKDRNGKEIYEGDVVRNGGFICTVDYEAGAFQLVAIETSDEGCWDLLWEVCRRGRMESVEVIGNIHENPELLTSAIRSENARKG